MTDKVQKLHDLLQANLLDVVEFWLKHSIDREYGGYFNSIDSDGTIYDDTKFVWLQCRAVYMFSRLYCHPIIQYNPKFVHLKQKLLDAAKNGIDFIVSNVLFKDGNNGGHYRCYFSVSRNGVGLSMQRKIFSECFFVMALIAFAKLVEMENKHDKLTKIDYYNSLAMNVFKDIIVYIDEPELLGFKFAPSKTSIHFLEPLNVPMICLNIIDEIRFLFNDKLYNQSLQTKQYFDQLSIRFISDILKHIDFKNKLLRENVCANGLFNDKSSLGRLVCPGHAIEASWFLYEFANKYGNFGFEKDLKQLAVLIFDWSFEIGWDQKNGGIYYFVDALKLPTVQLESNMKLWWPVNEAMVALATFYCYENESIAKRNFYLELLEKVTNYSLKHFADGFEHKNGAWFGYLNKYSNAELTIKGGPYKGFFHVPRSLLFTTDALKRSKTIKTTQMSSKL